MTRQGLSAWLFAFLSIAVVSSAQAKDRKCARIVDGTIATSDGEPIGLGFDEYGYNYQARLFTGSYCDSTRGGTCDPAYEDVHLSMKWNDEWLSTRDCDGDGRLDRPASYRGSDAWLLNFLRGSYELEGRTCHYRQQTIYLAAPTDAELVDGVFYLDGEELGPQIWNDFYVAERRLHDPCGGANDESL